MQIKTHTNIVTKVGKNSKLIFDRFEKIDTIDNVLYKIINCCVEINQKPFLMPKEAKETSI